MGIIAIAVLIYGIVVDLPPETLFMGLAIMVAGLSAGERITYVGKTRDED